MNLSLEYLFFTRPFDAKYDLITSTTRILLRNTNSLPPINKYENVEWITKPFQTYLLRNVNILLKQYATTNKSRKEVIKNDISVIRHIFRSDPYYLNIKYIIELSDWKSEHWIAFLQYLLIVNLLFGVNVNIKFLLCLLIGPVLLKSVWPPPSANDMKKPSVPSGLLWALVAVSYSTSNSSRVWWIVYDGAVYELFRISVNNKAALRVILIKNRT